MSAPFAERGKLGFVRAYLETWRMATLEPARFFRQVKVNETGWAVVFAVIAGTIAAFVGALVSHFTIGRWAEALTEYLPSAPSGSGEWPLAPFLFRSSGLVELLFAPLGALMAVVLLACIHHVFLLLVGGANRGFNATLTTVSYSYGVVIFTAVPVVGGLVFLVWYLVLVTTGFRETQRCGAGKASFAALSPALLACCCMGVVGTALIVALGKGFHP